MNHIVNFSVDINEDAIRKQIEKCIVDDVKAAIEDEYIKKQRYYSSKPEVGPALKEVIDNCANTIVTEHKSELLDRIAEAVAEKIFRSKAFKEKMNDVL